MNEQDKKVKVENESILINNLIINDSNTSKILKDIKEDKREDFIKKAIIIGAIGLRNLYLTENVDYIEKEFKEVLKGLESQSKDIKNNLEKEFRELLKSSENQSKDIKNMIEKTLDVDSNSSSLGKMRVLFEDYFDKRKGKISDLLSPFEEGSPINKLKEEIFKKIQDLRDELIKEKATGEMMEKTTLKGSKFEEVVLESIEDFCSEYEDIIAFVGENLGKNNKIGDIAVDIDGDENKRVIIECKDSSAYSHKKTIDEINDAIENRSAKFGIFLFKSQSQIPTALAPMKITNNYIITSFDNYGLYFAYRVARLFVERNGEVNKKAIPVDEIQKQVEGLQMKLLDFKNIQTKLTQIDNASDYIRENIDRLKRDIETGLSSIKELLTN
ncbi:MAG: hypothetical protein AABW51_04690 [Nanoarchaeota archaeon]